LESSRKTSLASEWPSKVEAELKQNAEFGSRRQEIIESRPRSFRKRGIGKQVGFQKPTDDTHSAIKFEDTRLRSFVISRVLDPKLPAQAEAVRIFDNIVERASREMMQNLV
jgi:hypothetical protein